MATSIGTMKQGVYTGPGSGTTVNITNVTQDSGSDGYLYLILMHQNNYTPTASYNGSGMTKFLSYSGQGVYWDIYELASPSTGSNTLTLTYNPWQEYGSNISYWIISTTGAAGYGNTKTASGLASGSGLNCNLSSITTGSAVVLAATLPHPTYYNQTLTVDSTTRDYDPGGNTTPYTQQTGTANRSTGWYKESVSTGNTNMKSDWGYNMAGVAFEILAGGGGPPPPAPPPVGRRRIIIT